MLDSKRSDSVEQRLKTLLSKYIKLFEEKIMEPYKNLNGDSGIIAFEIGGDYIKVKFKDGQWTLYIYTHQSAGLTAIETMKTLARQGYDLNSYISTHKPPYSLRS